MKKKLKNAIAWAGVILFILLILAINSESVMDKTEGYSYSDCNEICELVYDLELQEAICSNNCFNYEFPSKSADKYINLVKGKL